MRIVYVTVRFPAPFETFAGLDVLTLLSAGEDVRVLAMRSRVVEHARLVRERGLEAVSMEHASAAGVLAGMGEALRRPAKSLRLLGFALSRTWRKPGHLAASIALFPSAMRCYARIRDLSPDVVHLFWGHFPSLVGYLVARYHPGIVLSHFLGAYDLEYRYGPSGPVANLADVVWTHARDNTADIAALGVPGDAIHVAHRGIELPDVVADGPRTPCVLAAGRLIPAKRFDDVLEVFAAVHRRHPDATLAIAGDGPERARLQRIATKLGIAGSVEFPGRLPQSALFDLYNRTRVFLVMSRSPSERLPNAAKEAAARGCVTVTTRSPGIDELFDDGVHAHIVQPGDVAAAADRVSRLLDDDAEWRRMSDAGRERIASAFDVTKTMARYVETWRALQHRHETERT